MLPQSAFYSPEGRLFVHPAAAGLRPDRLDAVVDERALHPRDHHLLRHLPEERTTWMSRQNLPSFESFPRQLTLHFKHLYMWTILGASIYDVYKIVGYFFAAPP